MVSEYPKHLQTKDNLDESLSSGHKGEQPDDPDFRGIFSNHIWSKGIIVNKI
jgi:hypothetical protein